MEGPRVGQTSQCVMEGPRVLHVVRSEVGDSVVEMPFVGVPCY